MKLFKALTPKEVHDFQDWANTNKDKTITLEGMDIRLMHPVIRHQLGMWIIGEAAQEILLNREIELTDAE